MPAELPRRLHGDLWNGNVIWTQDAGCCVIDPAAHGGHRETELAMLTLFGSPPREFFDAYAEHAPLRADWRQRTPLYNLYHLLNHVNLFGAGYLPSFHHALFACGPGRLR